MYYTIEPIAKLVCTNSRNERIELPGFAFMDKYNRCITTVYTEGRRKSMAELLAD